MRKNKYGCQMHSIYEYYCRTSSLLTFLYFFQDMNELHWSIIIQSDIEYFDVTLSIKTSPISSNLKWCIGTVNE